MMVKRKAMHKDMEVDITDNFVNNKINMHVQDPANTKNTSSEPLTMTKGQDVIVEASNPKPTTEQARDSKGHMTHPFNVSTFSNPALHSIKG